MGPQLPGELHGVIVTVEDLAPLAINPGDVKIVNVVVVYVIAELVRRVTVGLVF